MDDGICMISDKEATSSVVEGVGSGVGLGLLEDSSKVLKDCD